jgi:hypothetical protein
MIFVVISLVLVLLAAAGYGIHRLLLGAERRGWIFYRERRRPPGPSLGLLSTIYAPEMEHVIEEESSQTTRREDAESGRGDEAADPSPDPS